MDAIRGPVGPLRGPNDTVGQCCLVPQLENGLLPFRLISIAKGRRIGNVPNVFAVEGGAGTHRNGGTYLSQKGNALQFTHICGFTYGI